jgi:centractin
MDHGAVPVVVDAGSGVIKAGFAGDDKPKALFSNVLGRPKHKRVMAGGALEGEKCVSSWHTGANGDGYNRTSTVQRILCQHLGGAHSLILFCSFLGQQVDSHRGALIVSHPMERGAISDWDGMARVLSHIFDGSNLSVPPEEQPVSNSAAAFTTQHVTQPPCGSPGRPFSLPDTAMATQLGMAYAAHGRAHQPHASVS